MGACVAAGPEESFAGSGPGVSGDDVFEASMSACAVACVTQGIDTDMVHDSVAMSALAVACVSDDLGETDPGARVLFACSSPACATIDTCCVSQALFEADSSGTIQRAAFEEETEVCIIGVSRVPLISVFTRQEIIDPNRWDSHQGDTANFDSSPMGAALCLDLADDICYDEDQDKVTITFAAPASGVVVYSF